MGRLQRTGSSEVTYVDAEPALAQLLRDFGPTHPGARRRPRIPSITSRATALWTLASSGGSDLGANASRLRSAGAAGRLSPDFEVVLRTDPVCWCWLRGSSSRQLPRVAAPGHLQRGRAGPGGGRGAGGAGAGGLAPSTRSSLSRRRSRCVRVPMRHVRVRRSPRDRNGRARRRSCALVGVRGPRHRRQRPVLVLVPPQAPRPGRGRHW